MIIHLSDYRAAKQAAIEDFEEWEAEDDAARFLDMWNAKMKYLFNLTRILKDGEDSCG